MNAIAHPPIISVCRDDAFDLLQDVAHQAAVFALAAERAAWRGNEETLRVRLDQLRHCTIAAIKVYKENLAALPSRGNAA